MPKDVAVTEESLKRWLRPLHEMGLEGVETIRADVSEAEMDMVASVARELSMLRTAGSDFQLSYGEIVRVYRNDLDYSKYL